jgi:DNA polymerase-3 subunit delta'
VGVVAEAERMTVEAQNAFLKTLEEPPGDTVLILTTNNINMLLPTTQSRCQVLRVGPMPREALTRILTRERSLDPDQARLVAALARGNARRALDFDLGFVVAFRQKMMTRLVALDPSDRVAMIAFAEELAKSGHPLESVFDLLLEFYRDTLLCALGMGEINNPDLENLVREEARRNPPAAIIKKMETIHQARLRANGNANPRLNLEILTMSLRGVDGAEITAP